MSDAPAVLDASALLALLQDEPGAAQVASRLPGAAISAVNLSEVIAKLADYGISAAEAQAALDDLDLDIRPFDAAAAYAAGALRAATRQLGLSLGDRACVALAIQLGATAVTADRAWGRLSADLVRVEVIR